MPLERLFFKLLELTDNRLTLNYKHNFSDVEMAKRTRVKFKLNFPVRPTFQFAWDDYDQTYCDYHQVVEVH